MASARLDANKVNKDKGKALQVYVRRPKKAKRAAFSPRAAKDVSRAVDDVSRASSRAAVSPVRDPPTDHQALVDESLRKSPENGLVVAVPVVPIVTVLDDRVKICVNGSTRKDDIVDLKGRLEGELEEVRRLYRRLEDKGTEITTRQQEAQQALVTPPVVDVDMPVYNEIAVYEEVEPVYNEVQPVYEEVEPVYNDVQPVYNEVRPVYNEVPAYNHQAYTESQYYDRSVSLDRRGLVRVNSEMGRFRPLTVSVLDNEYGEKEKRTPKANQFYRNTDFLLGKDRLPPENTKRMKPGRKSEFSSGLERHKSQVMRSCNNLLLRLMKHKHGWVFNEPVNAKLLGLHDYHDIIKHPMDLGTIKSRLDQNFYKIPSEFAEDVKLTFSNAMTYNPIGHDVYIMAETLLNIFEERWVVIESDWRHGPPVQNHNHNYNQNINHSFMSPPARTLDRSQSMVLPKPVAYVPPPLPPVVRTPVPKKPKAREPNKRDMTYEEKQKLSTNLQSLPPEKLDSIVQIIKKGSNNLSQNDEEIEVDIDSVDVETLWELDRFVMNYRKNLSKVKRRAEIQQARALAAGNNMIQNAGAPVPHAIQEQRTGGKSPAAAAASPPRQGNNGSRSSSSSSSSSDSSSDDSSSSSSSEDGSPRR